MPRKAKEARKSTTTILIKKRKKHRITLSRDPMLELCKRIFRSRKNTKRAKKFLNDVIDRKKEGNPIKTNEWKNYIEKWQISRSSFYNMRNQLIAAGLIELRKGEYHPSKQFSNDLKDMAEWWETQTQ
ncbi:hypothetical protein [Methanonatronarchaeum sp. AMET-Sl]|uniref:hypothetical protein n=1 Tax=Methanonatronarchaeum sp. AMET-Sl TaxID=3037654 RepID=UPI00244E1DB1|nr:hypothetical protein [Methanonatronarchaeum sp. AMET-Sl]WGI18113.1 hypothetical protein QEN48_03675 [Methanonatronarchaeum sp. AMET-Sl]